MALPCCVAFVVAVADHHLPTSAPGSRPTLSSTRSCIRLGAVLPRAIHRPLGVGRTWSKWCIPKSSGAWIPNIFQMDPNGCPRVPGSQGLDFWAMPTFTVGPSTCLGRFYRILPYLIWVSFSQWASNPSGCLDVSTPNSWSDRPSTAAEASTWARGRSEVICLCNFFDPNHGPAEIRHLSWQQCLYMGSATISEKKQKIKQFWDQAPIIPKFMTQRMQNHVIVLNYPSLTVTTSRFSKPSQEEVLWAVLNHIHHLKRWTMINYPSPVGSPLPFGIPVMACWQLLRLRRLWRFPLHRAAGRGCGEHGSHGGRGGHRGRRGRGGHSWGRSGLLQHPGCGMDLPSGKLT